MDVYLSPKESFKVVNISLNDFVPDEQPTWNGRPTIYILYVYGKEPAPLNFYIDIETTEGFSENVAAVDIAVTGKYIHDKKIRKTNEFQTFLDSFPDWSVITMIALGYYESWVF